MNAQSRTCRAGYDRFVRNMTGARYLRLMWGSWILGVVCVIIIALTISWQWAVGLGAFLGLSAWNNVTAGRRVADRIDERRR